MDQIQHKKVLEKLGKIKALAERGVGGEKETAKRMYVELCAKYGISEDETESALNEVERRFFRYKTELERSLLIQIFYKVTGDTKSYVYAKPHRNRKEIGCDCTPLEAAEIDLLFEFYRKAMKEELEVFMMAFKQQNRLFPDKTARCYEEIKEPPEMSEEDERKYKKAAFMRMPMEFRTPPRAAIGESGGGRK